MSRDRQIEPLVRFEDVHRAFGGEEVLCGIDLEVSPSETTCLVGPSGAGKSTFLRCVNLVEQPTSSSIFVDGIEVTAPDAPLDRTCSRIGMVFQDFRLFPHLTALQDCTLAPKTVLRLSKAEATRRARSMLARVRLESKAESHPSKLSGGQQQRVAIARALCMDPMLMLFDEPTSALDPELIGEVLSVISELAEARLTMLVVTHEMGFARCASDRILMLDHGRIVADSAPERFFADLENDRVGQFLGRPCSPINP